MKLNKLTTATLLIAILSIVHFGINLETINRYDLIAKFKQIDVPVSQDLVIIEIDNESLKFYDSWPWKRGIYANLLEKLATAYPKTVAFDIDFSSTSSLREDMKFAKALEQAPFPVILAEVITAVEHSADGVENYLVNKPIDLFADHVTLANANSLPNDAGQVFKYAFRADNGLASIAATLANKNLNTDGSVWIDYSMDLHTFPTYSVKDILEGNFNSAKIAGKNFLIGSTAIDLGDKYTLPKYGRTSGIYVHALAYESIVSGDHLQLVGAESVLVIAIVTLLVLVFAFNQTKLKLFLTGNVALAAIIYLTSVILHHFYQLILPTSLLYVSVVIASIFHLLGSLKSRAKKYFQVKNSDNFNKALINHMIRDNSNGIIITNVKGEILITNQKACQIFSIDSSAVENRSSVFKFIPDSEALFQTAEQRVNSSQPTEIVEQTLKNKTGQEFVIEMMIKKSKFVQNIGNGGKTKVHQLFNFMITDITEKMNILASQKKSELALIDLKYNDPLTKLPNRLSFNNKLQTCFSDPSKVSCMVVMLNIDSAKEIAEVYGTAAVDKAIYQIADMIRHRIGENVTLARYSDHVFGLIYNQIDPKNNQQHNNLLQQIYDLFTLPINLEGQKIIINISMGVVIAPQHGKNSDKLLNNVMQVLEYAINSTSLNWFFYEADLAQKARDKRQIKIELVRAIENEEFVLYYQPQHDMASGNLIGYESLIRWEDPDKGLRFPDEFIPVAEEFGLIVEIGELVLKMGCHDAAKWPDHLTVAINVSPAQFVGADITTLCAKYLAETGLLPHRLELEITESMMMYDVDSVIKTLLDVRKLGVKIAMDDFGTGYSSLQYLTQLPFDKIKIDRSFTMNIGKSKQADALITSIVALGHSLDKIVLAEGIETPDMVAFLKATGCEIGQGYHYGKPASIVDVHKQIRLS